MEGSVYLLYEGDQYLSSSSLVLMGVFTSPESLKVNAEKLIRQNGKKHVRDREGQLIKGDDYFDDCKTMEDKINVVVEDILLELMSRRSTVGWETNYSTHLVALDELGEI